MIQIFKTALLFSTFLYNSYSVIKPRQQAIKSFITDNHIAIPSLDVLIDTPKTNTGCIIDTIGIFTNQHLPSLINELNKTPLTIHKTIKAIPPFIMDFLKCSRAGDFSIANPGEIWQVTDVIFEKLPERQLIFFGTGDSICLMTHFTGGIGKSEHILIFKFNKGGITDFWCGVSGKDLITKHQVIEYLIRIKNREPRLPTNSLFFLNIWTHTSHQQAQLVKTKNSYEFDKKKTPQTRSLSRNYFQSPTTYPQTTQPASTLCAYERY